MSRAYGWFVLLVGMFVFLASFSGAGQALSEAHKVRLVEAYGRLPLSFIANAGQVVAEVRYYARGPGYTIFLTPEEIWLVLASRTAPVQTLQPVRVPVEEKQTRVNPEVVRIRVVQAQAAAEIEAEERLPGRVNYFRGKDPQSWQTDVPIYGRVRYKGVYPGIDLVFYGNQRVGGVGLCWGLSVISGCIYEYERSLHPLKEPTIYKIESYTLSLPPKAVLVR